MKFLIFFILTSVVSCTNTKNNSRSTSTKTTIPTTTSSSSLCSDGSVKVNNICPSDCQARGMAYQNGRCIVSCNASLFQIPNANQTQCVCMSGYDLVGSGSSAQCVQRCGSNEVRNSSNQCQCISGYARNSQGVCELDCRSAGLHKVPNGNVCTCPDNTSSTHWFEKVNGDCKECPLTSDGLMNDGSCESCSAGQEFYRGACLSECTSSSTQSNFTSHQCVCAATEYFKQGTGCITAAECTSGGGRLDSASKICTACPSGKVPHPTDPTQCIDQLNEATLNTNLNDLWKVELIDYLNAGQSNSNLNYSDNPYFTQGNSALYVIPSTFKTDLKVPVQIGMANNTYSDIFQNLIKNKFLRARDQTITKLKDKCYIATPQTVLMETRSIFTKFVNHIKDNPNDVTSLLDSDIIIDNYIAESFPNSWSEEERIKKCFSPTIQIQTSGAKSFHFVFANGFNQFLTGEKVVINFSDYAEILDSTNLRITSLGTLAHDSKADSRVDFNLGTTLATDDNSSYPFKTGYDFDTENDSYEQQYFSSFINSADVRVVKSNKFLVIFFRNTDGKKVYIKNLDIFLGP